MGLKEVEIVFDNTYNTYYAGQTVNGRVIFTFDSPKKVRGIYIKFKGEADTKWWIEEKVTSERGDETERVELTGHEEYFKIQYFLVGGSGSGEVELPAGQHTYPFTCVLPPTLPSSFEGEFGHIRYTVKVVLDRPWKFDQETKVAFTVLSHVDLNHNSSLREPQRLEFEKFFGCLCCKSGPLTCVISIPCRGYVPGQVINIVAEVDNISNVEVTSVDFNFRKSVTYYSQSPRRESKQDNIVLESVKVGPIPGHESKTWNQQLTVPPLPPSNLMNCQLIDLDYELFLECVVSGLHSNLKSKIPLTIGTIPLSGLAGAPSAPVADSPKNDNSGGLVGWVNADGSLYPSVPIFAESQFGTMNIRDGGDNEYTRINNAAYKPMYPVYNFGAQ